MGETESFACHVPDLPELAEVLQIGLKKNYADVQVSVVECPDLTQEPFRFPVKGICGKARIADVGGVPYLVPLARLDKIYNINAVAKEIELPGAFILGAGAVSHRTLGENAELILSVQAAYGDKAAVNGSYVARISPAGGGCVLEKYSDRYTDCDFGLLSNLYASRGEPGKVIQVSASRRTGKENFVSCMRKTLESHYGDKPVGMGGTFIIQEGKAKLHIMPPEFSTCPLNTDEDVNLWLKFFEMRAPLICQSVFVSRDPGFDLRLEHTHCFSHHGEGGHYHTDTTPETVRYLGYFHPAELLYRIDRPKETHTVGRD
ncbi:ester hydrolase C11orf54 homolog isoform X1 [Rhinatrema bivittatum]|uniref:ester hydrolase C11orf54 homolog isoform X1 n=1 Tax=Rhinatrema bivittatum TaxID=194408 RepID=UPI001126BF87|nr:ester hydrolase C11orf54 homolog isoform X1 [Rhinatrema bivittatum]XP_029468541.1 ester hydrolase C11orf54 homolog isoform X1 [Rhinatrema bivittatum]